MLMTSDTTESIDSYAPENAKIPAVKRPPNCSDAPKLFKIRVKKSTKKRKTKFCVRFGGVSSEELLKVQPSEPNGKEKPYSKPFR